MSDRTARLRELSPEQLARLQARLQLRQRSAGEARAAGSASAIPRADRGGELPLSFAQERLWFSEHLEPGTATYNVALVLEVRGPLDVAALEASFAAIVGRHEVLRTVYSLGAAGPVQRVLPADGFRLAVEELSGVPGEARAAEARRRAAEEVQRPLDLERGPVIRASLLRLAPESHVLVAVVHHIAFDAASTGVLAGELAALYGALAGGRSSPLPELPLQYGDFAVWQRARLRGPTLEAQLAWWRERLAGAPGTLALPDDYAGEVSPFRAASHPLEISLELAEALRALSRREGVTLYITLLAVFKTLLCVWTGEEDVVVGTSASSRQSPELEPLIGFFVNTFPLRTDLGGDPTFRELLGRVRESMVGAFAHADVPLEQLAAELHGSGAGSRTPLFQAFFNLLVAGGEPLSLPGLEVEVREPALEAIKFDVELWVTDTGRGVRAVLGYNAARFEPATARRMAAELQAVLREAAADPDRRISSVSGFPDEERAGLVDDFNDPLELLPN
ncbi:MAG TPA: condensation domain-containing protein [Longimicrobiaceae bacterium]|nr:condensation domain-containing protein [Longimicrobiaceae bacterium]